MARGVSVRSHAGQLGPAAVLTLEGEQAIADGRNLLRHAGPAHSKQQESQLLGILGLRFAEEIPGTLQARFQFVATARGKVNAQAANGERRELDAAAAQRGTDVVLVPGAIGALRMGQAKRRGVGVAVGLEALVSQAKEAIGNVGHEAWHYLAVSLHQAFAKRRPHRHGGLVGVSGKLGIDGDALRPGVSHGHGGQRLVVAGDAAEAAEKRLADGLQARKQRFQGGACVARLSHWLGQRRWRGRLGAGVPQEAGDLGLSPGEGPIEHGTTVLIARVEVGTFLNEQADQFQVVRVAAGGHHEGCEAAIAFHVEIGAVVEQNLDGWGGAFKSQKSRRGHVSRFDLD